MVDRGLSSDRGTSACVVNGIRYLCAVEGTIGFYRRDMVDKVLPGVQISDDVVQRDQGDDRYIIFIFNFLQRGAFAFALFHAIERDHDA